MMAASVKEKKLLSSGEISAFCAQLALIIKAGVPVREGVGIMAEDTDEAYGREILSGMLEQLEEGRTLAFALGQSGSFPKYVVDMVDIGETSGRLDEVMESLSAYYERNEAISKSIKNAVTYPAVMIVMMALVIGVLVAKVLPIFQQVFRQLGSEMSAFSQGVMNFGTLLGRYSAVIIAVIVAVVAALLIMRATKGGRAALSRMYDTFFLTRKLSARISAGRFASAMSLMLSSGLDVDQSLDMAYSLIENEKTRARITQLKSSMEQGESFSDALMKTGIFSGVYARMVAVGFKTGSVDGVMKKIALRYEDEIDTQVGNVLSILEPTLVAVLSIIVGMILLSVMLPLMGVMSSIG